MVVSFNLSRIDAYSYILLNALISDSILPSFTTSPSKHFHPCYSHLLHALFLGWPTLCSIGHSWPNRQPQYGWDKADNDDDGGSLEYINRTRRNT